jgi:hypothetical protein
MMEVPKTTAHALSPEWLRQALTGVSKGSAITQVECVEVIRTVATKIRFTVKFEDLTGAHAFCLKGLLDADEMTARGGPTMVREADFYGQIAQHIDVRIPECVVQVVDREAQQAIIIMRDLIADGARFCTALEPFTIEQVAASLGQIARLHARRDLVETSPWITRRIAELAKAQYVPQDQLQDLLDGPRGMHLPPSVRNAPRLIAAMRALAERDAERPHFLVHGDSHAGNIFSTPDGPGLIDWQLLQRGGWALDVAYHISAALPVDVAEKEERALLARYLDMMRGFGCEMPDADTAWLQYREAAVYGYYLWSITRRVDPAVINLFVTRLGSAVTRHESHKLLGVA